MQKLRGPKVPTADMAAVDAYYLDRALDLAWLGAGRTQANPMVGAVVVKDGRIVGEGYHAAYGLDHAETIALDAAGNSAVGATLYVTLEPCTHQGKTPPCTDRIVASEVARVVACTLDPDPRMDGRGVAILRDAGIEVAVGVGVDRAIALNLPYFKRVLRLGPAVTLKAATTIDGRIAALPGTRDRVTGKAAQHFTHGLRATRDAVLVGIGTVLTDAPILDSRCLEDAAVPTPVVLDSTLRFPPDYRWLAEDRCPVVVTRDDADRTRARSIEEAGGAVVTCGGRPDGLCTKEVVEALAGRGVASVLVEGGAAVLSSFMENGPWDDFYQFLSPQSFGPAGVSVSDRRIGREVMNARAVDARRIGDEICALFMNRSTYEAIARRVT
jgi:diaminohydroxyphosphoribosylaminopyrimidine deaminase/5-amino-6-(5-phosphoribosylamino)uracil reductase